MIRVVQRKSVNILEPGIKNNMAEGLEVELPLSSQRSQRYFCHLCIREVSAVHPDLTCPRCHSGFIEEVTPDPEDAESEDSDLDIEAASPLIEVDLSDLIRRTIRRTILDFTEREGYSDSLRQSLAAAASLSTSEERPSNSDDRISIPVFPVGEIVDELGPGNIRDFVQIATNLGDYAFGVEWDAIITQILNEDEVTGPPPLDKKQIDTIPLVPIKKAHMSQGLQCTICMENFQITEKVKSLPCEHLFHTNCIVPWLEMHATCPICRKQISS